MSFPHSPVIDTYTGKTLGPKWKAMELLLPFPKGEATFECIVLLEKPMHAGGRICMGAFHANIIRIDGRFSFDMPKPIAWQHLPKI